MAKAAYHVVGDGMKLDTRLNQAGTGLEDIHVVPYQIDSGPAAGITRHVKIPHSTWQNQGANAVQAAIEDDVNMAHDVASIKQG